MITITIDGKTKKYEKGIRIQELADEMPLAGGRNILLAMVNGRLRELWKTLKEDSIIEFLTWDSPDGRKAYERALIFVMIKAVRDTFSKNQIRSVSVEYAIGNGLYCELYGESIIKNKPLSQEIIQTIKKRMDELIAENLMFRKFSVRTETAMAMFRENHLLDKEHLFRYRRGSRTNIYQLEDCTDYFYGYMPPNTGVLKSYDLVGYNEGMILVMPEHSARMEHPMQKSEKDSARPSWQPREKLFQTLHGSSDWGRTMGIHNVGALNDAIAQGRMQDLILVQEALQEQRIAQIAEKIAGQPNKKMVMIAGPSSSGKTTFSHRLSIALQAHGLQPHPVAVDDYFLNREDTPKNPDGSYNFECLEAIDTARFNRDMQALLHGEEVELPTFNFRLGRREYKGNVKKLGADDILVMEGIHALNDKLSYSLPRENKFKIYISALNQLNIDEHNRIPTTDGRLLRRIVRDARTRGTSGKDTIAMWGSVRRGEEQNIFPFQEESDVMFNSALIYELAVIKLYAEPILFGIEKNDPEYVEAKRLLKFLDYFLGVSTEDIPKNSIIREFIGGSCFRV